MSLASTKSKDMIEGAGPLYAGIALALLAWGAEVSPQGVVAARPLPFTVDPS